MKPIVMIVSFNNYVGSFKLTNSAVIPNEGEHFDCCWHKYIKDKALLSKILDFVEHDLFYVHRDGIYYAVEYTGIYVCLFPSEQYKAEFHSIRRM